LSQSISPVLLLNSKLIDSISMLTIMLLANRKKQ
jgi:hypothetical protein